MGSSDEFIAKVLTQLRDLRRSDAALRAQEEGVRRRREELAGQIEVLESSLRVYRDVMELPEEASPERTLFGEVALGTVADMAYEILSRHEGPMKVADLTKILEGLGKFAGTAENVRTYATVYGSLSRDSRFTRTDQGEFDLSERRASAALGQLERLFRLNFAPHPVTVPAPQPDHVLGDETSAVDGSPHVENQSPSPD